MPLYTTDIDDLDAATMTYVDQLTSVIDRMREQVRVLELLRHAAVKSISHRSEDMQQLELRLDDERQQSTHHRPMVVDKDREAEVLRSLERTLHQTLRNDSTTTN